MSDWLNTPTNIEDYEGFVYAITNSLTGRVYIGQKGFWKIHKLPPLKGRTQKEKLRRQKLKGNKRHVKKPSDWQNYWGSSEELHSDIEKYGVESFRREILACCSSKSVRNYIELSLQMKHNVLFDDKYYNNIINIRMNSNMVLSKNDEIRRILEDCVR